MTPELEEFRQRILSHAKLVASRAPKIESEASTNASLVQPFLTTLGYAPKDVVRTPPERQDPISATPIVAQEPEAEGFSPTEGEIAAFTYAKNRLFYLLLEMRPCFRKSKK